MREIKEILQFVQQGYFSSSLMIDDLAKGEGATKMAALLTALEKGMVHSDEDAAALLYPDDTEGSRYRKLKSDLKVKLHKAVMNMNPVQARFTDYQSAYYYCHKQWVVIKMLTGLNANASAVTLAIKLLKQSEKYHFTLLSMDILAYLRVQYGVREANFKKYQPVDIQCKNYAKLYQAELLAEEYYTELTVRLANNHAKKHDVHLLAKLYSEEISKPMVLFSSYKLQMYGYLIGLMQYSTINDFEGALAYASEAVAYFSSLPYEAKVPMQIFNYQILVSNIQLRRFKEGEVVAQKCLALFEEGSFNWFKYQDLYFLLMLHTAEYEKAGVALRFILGHPKFEFLPDTMKETWRLYEAYIYYLTLFGLLSKEYTRKFKLSRFISDTSILIKDKGGRNVAVIIIRLLILLREERFTQLLDEMESTHQYCYNYLRGDNTRRSFSLIKMLLLIPLSQYDPKVVESKTERYKKVLDESMFDIHNQTYEIEIIPFEILWDLTLKGLKERKI